MIAQGSDLDDDALKSVATDKASGQDDPDAKAVGEAGGTFDRRVVISSIVDALIQMLDSLPEPVIPYALYEDALNASDPTSLKKVCPAQLLSVAVQGNVRLTWEL